MFLRTKKKQILNKKFVNAKGGIIMKITISKSFLRGYIRVLDIYGQKNWPDISNDRQRDYEKLRGDWENVGKYIRESTDRYRSAQG